MPRSTCRDNTSHKILSQTPGLVVSKKHARLLWMVGIEHGWGIVVKDDLKLMDLLEVV